MVLICQGEPKNTGRAGLHCKSRSFFAPYFFGRRSLTGVSDGELRINPRFAGGRLCRSASESSRPCAVACSKAVTADGRMDRSFEHRKHCGGGRYYLDGEADGNPVLCMRVFTTAACFEIGVADTWQRLVTGRICLDGYGKAKMSCGGGLGAGFSYHRFVQFALEQTRLRTALAPHPSQEKFKFIKSNEDNTVFSALSFSTPKVRLLRSLTIEQKNSVQVLDFATFSEPEYDLPIFCANAFTSPARSIVVLDLNPLYDTIAYKDYREKYYRNLMPLAHKYSELLPWGGKITSESLRFFSPAVIWTIFEPTEANHQVLYAAFMDYYQVWLELMDEAAREISEEKIDRNREAQHKYLTWRAEKDPGYPLLKKLIGDSLAKNLVTEFLFEGVNTLGSKTFLDYFPEYSRDDGTINKKRSIIGKSFESRPWNAHGEFIGDADEG